VVAPWWSGIFAAAPDKNAKEDAHAERDGDRLVGVLANGRVRVLGARDDLLFRAVVGIGEAFLDGSKAVAQVAERVGGVLREGVGHHRLRLGDERLQLREELLGCVGGFFVVFHDFVKSFLGFA